MSGSTRDAVLNRIRRANGARPGDPERAKVVAERLGTAPRGIVPKRGQLPQEERVRLFLDMAEKANATVARVADYAELPEAVATFLREKNLPAELKLGADPRFADLDFSQTALSVTHGASDGDDLAALSHAMGGIAETGTLMLTSGPDNPTSLNFLPEYHVVAVAAEDVAGDMETLLAKLRETFGKGGMPRSVNFVTGPSRSADIEQTLLLGAHGPRSLHIVVVG
ncbi:lactate utilization protein C [Jiella sp. M17.18]|uniref:LutC/YkgG family protein n=1 Tax=Jiella sp. M17.18 TaxID=3234247 RepID=UPI0034DFFBAC